MSHTQHQQKWPAWKLVRLFFLAAGVCLLGYVGYALLDAKLFQAYENRQFDMAVKRSSSSTEAVRAATIPVSSAPHDEVHLASGSVLGRIEISRIGVAVIVLEGTEAKTLRRSVGHITGTALPGEQGNIAIAGHRDTFFRGLRNIRQDDEVTLTTIHGSYLYRVDSMKIVDPEDLAVLKSTDESTLTLVTCYPFDFVGPAPKRFIVHAHRGQVLVGMAQVDR